MHEGDEIIKNQDLLAIPSAAMDYFESKSSQLIAPKDYKKGNFDTCFMIKNEGGDTTYAVKQTKTYDTNGDTEVLIYLADINENGEMEGNGEIRFNISNKKPFFVNKPFVGFTFTEEAYQKRGLGLRRLETMNHLAQKIFGFPLYSDTLILEDARKLWKTLVEQGKATQFIEGTRERFRFH